MDIQSAKQELKNAISVYLDKDAFGGYLIPVEKQRPVFLMGPPGIGKTAIVEQVAQEMQIGLLTYSMTHHTRQSALGLPFIEHRSFEEMEFDISEYTMSEIIAAIYEVMEHSGVREGILFLDEINCVSETLAPAMLQFLQYKIFGRHHVPEGWVVVTAGNPPEFNDAAREFDIATWDRLKRVDVDANYTAWKKYAVNHGVHPSITTYLDIKRADFYHLETTVNGKIFVTARGWEDLSVMITRYEAKEIPVTETLIAQYLQHPRIAKDFAIYYDLFVKYRSDYQIAEILNGEIAPEMVARAHAAKFDERLAVSGLLLDGVYAQVQDFTLGEQMVLSLHPLLKKIKSSLKKAGNSTVMLLSQLQSNLREAMESAKAAGNLSTTQSGVFQMSLSFLEDAKTQIQKTAPATEKEAFAILQKMFQSCSKNVGAMQKKSIDSIENMLDFAEQAFGEGQEILVLITELTSNENCSKFVSRNPSERFVRFSQSLMLRERDKEIMTELETIDWDKLDWKDEEEEVF